MLRNIKSDIIRAVVSRRFIAGVVGVIAVIAFASIGDALKVMQAAEPPEYGYHIKFTEDILRSDAFTLTLPILAALPFTTAFVDDMKSGFIKQYLSRTSRKRYMAGKLISCGLSGALMFLPGILLAFFISAAFIAPLELPLEDGQVAQTFFWVEATSKTFIIAFSGMFWSLIGFVLASFTMNRYMAYASPFIMYYLLIILHERYFYRLYMLYPKEWLFPEHEWALGGFGIIILIMFLTFTISLSFILFAERRLKNV
jgi:hypothetical protein